MSKKIKELEMDANPRPHQQPTIDTIDYPSVRYFQIHFEYMHEQLQLSVKLMENLHQQVLQLEQRLSKSHGLNQQPVAVETQDGNNVALKGSLKPKSLSNPALQREAEHAGVLTAKLNH